MFKDMADETNNSMLKQSFLYYSGKNIFDTSTYHIKLLIFNLS